MKIFSNIKQKLKKIYIFVAYTATLYYYSHVRCTLENKEWKIYILKINLHIKTYEIYEEIWDTEYIKDRWNIESTMDLLKAIRKMA